MARLVEQLQSDALDSSVQVSTLLRKVKLVAVKLSLGDLAAWVQSELEGYQSSPPDYRVLTGHPSAQNPYAGRWIPIEGPADIMSVINKAHVVQSIASIESLLADISTSVFYVPYNSRLAAMISGSMAITFPVMGVGIARSQLAGIVDRVRNLVLDWALSLEKRGILGSEVGFSEDERGRAAKMSINIGSFTGNLNQGDLSGTHARLNQGSTDQSSNRAGGTFSFDELAEAVEKGVRVRADREMLLEAVETLRRTEGTETFASSYHSFISKAADYITLVGPFLPALSALLLGSPAVA